MPVNPRIRKLYRQLGTIRAVSRALGVNPAHVHALLTKGIEPKDPKIRVKLFLPAKPRRPPAEKHRPIAPDHIRWWRTIPNIQKGEIILQHFKENNANRKDISNNANQNSSSPD